MRCKECSMLLDDYVERELNAKDTEQVTAHLAACAACAIAYQKLTREQNAYAQYLLGVEATPALWNNLQARIEEEKSVRPLPLLPRIRNRTAGVFSVTQFLSAQAAAVALVAIIAIIGTIKYKTPVETLTHNDVVVSQQSNGSDIQSTSSQDSTAALNGTRVNDPRDDIHKRDGKSRVVSSGKRTGKSRSSFTALNRTPRYVVPEPAINSRDVAGRDAKEQLMLALRITSTQLYVAQRKIQEEQRRTRPSVPVSEPNREMR